MSISEWFKRMFSSPGRGDTAVGTEEEVTIDEARIDAGGSGALGFPGEPDSHASPADELAESVADEEEEPA